MTLNPRKFFAGATALGFIGLLVIPLMLFTGCPPDNRRCCTEDGHSRYVQSCDECEPSETCGGCATGIVATSLCDLNSAGGIDLLLLFGEQGSVAVQIIAPQLTKTQPVFGWQLKQAIAADFGDHGTSAIRIHGELSMAPDQLQRLANQLPSPEWFQVAMAWEKLSAKKHELGLGMALIDGFIGVGPTTLRFEKTDAGQWRITVGSSQLTDQGLANLEFLLTGEVSINDRAVTEVGTTVDLTGSPTIRKVQFPAMAEWLSAYTGKLEGQYAQLAKNLRKPHWAVTCSSNK